MNCPDIYFRTWQQCTPRLGHGHECPDPRWHYLQPDGSISEHCWVAQYISARKRAIDRGWSTLNPYE